jgi:curved DNA-binding protein CbpA
MSLYDLLEIKPTATEAEIKKAYHRLALLYHPDKNSHIDATEKFQNITSAYQILIDEKSRKEYCKLSNNEQNKFVDLLRKIFKNNLALEELKSLGIKFEKSDWEYLEKNFYDLFNALNLKEILNFFKSGKFPKKKIDSSNIISETDNEVFDLYESYYDLPIHYQKISKNDIKINLDISLNELIDASRRKIKIKRNLEDEEITNTFLFDIEKPYIVFPSCGDMDNGEWGNLIIKLNLPNNFIWVENLILIQQPMTLYEMVYGINIKLSIGTSNLDISNWIPSRDGFLIEVNQCKIKNFMITIKLELNYESTNEKEAILKNIFS